MNQYRPTRETDPVAHCGASGRADSHITGTPHGAGDPLNPCQIDLAPVRCGLPSEHSFTNQKPGAAL